MYARYVKDRDFGKNKTGRVFFTQSYEFGLGVPIHKQGPSHLWYQFINLIE